MRSYLGLFFIAALFSLLVTPAVRTLGHWLQAYGQADGREQPHIPRLGGLAILVAALAAWAVLLLVPNDVRARFLSEWQDRKSTRLNSSHSQISYAVFCLKKKKTAPTFWCLPIPH